MPYKMHSITIERSNRTSLLSISKNILLMGFLNTSWNDICKPFFNTICSTAAQSILKIESAIHGAVLSLMSFSQRTYTSPSLGKSSSYGHPKKSFMG